VIKGITLEIEPLSVGTDPCVADQHRTGSTRGAAASKLFIALLPIPGRSNAATAASAKWKAASTVIESYSAVSAAGR
jgi:hypothetical protein